MDSGIVFVGTPIGDIEDISQKALYYLKKAEVFFCEDTRKSKDILKRLGVSSHEAKFKSLHDHSDRLKLESLIEEASSHLVVYLSDAGSPLISDPAYPIVQACLENKIEFKFASGITAPIYALENSGLPPIPFKFHGFLPREVGKVSHTFESLSKGTHIFFEGVSRVEKTLSILANILPGASVVLARECTKSFESFYRFEAKDYLNQEINYKGEFVLLIHQSKDKKIGSSKLEEIAQEILLKGQKPKLVSKLIADILDKNPKEIYQKLSGN